MPAQVIDGKAVSREILATLKTQISHLDPKPGLAVIMVGDDPASLVYVEHKEKACQKIGMYSEKIILPASTTPEALYSVIEALNHNPKIHGLLCQFPLPSSLTVCEDQVIRLISAAKDIDGFHPQNAGELLTAKRGLPQNVPLPCTPKGIMELIKRTGVSLKGKQAVILGRSNLVGKPLSLMLLAHDATVTLCHSQTQNLHKITREADVLVAAIGKPLFVTADMVKTGTIVIDVGINRTDSGIVGDVDYQAVAQKAAFITPVPGGVGPMTIAMLIQNAIDAYHRQLQTN